MAPGQHVDGLGKGDGINGFAAETSPCSNAISSSDALFLAPRLISDALFPMYALAISTGEAPTSSPTFKIIQELYHLNFSAYGG